MKNLLFAIAGLFWFVLVFVGTFYITFPSDTLVERVRYEAPIRLGNEYSVDLSSIAPWWVGLSAQDIKVFHTANGWRSEEAPETLLVGLAKDARLRVSPWSLLRRTPYVSGSLTLAEGTIDYAVGTGKTKKGDIGLSELQISADELPLADLMMLAPAGTELAATGMVDLAIDLEAGDKGMSDGNGTIRIAGSNIVLSDIVLPNIGPLGMDIPINEILVNAVVRDGKADIERGVVDSELLQVEVTGEITLRDPIDRSSLDLEFVVSDLGDQLKAFEGFMSAAKHADGKFHYACRGMLSRLSASTCGVPARERTSRVSNSRDRARSTSTPKPPTAAREPQVIDRSTSDEERDRRREEIRERLRQRREERESGDDREVPRSEHDEEEFDEALIEDEFDEDLGEEHFEDDFIE